MVVENTPTKGLPGLKAVRMAVGLTQEQLAFSPGCNKVHLGQIELGKRDCTQAVQRQLADRLCCTVIDLLYVVPGEYDPAKQLERETRLKQIAIAFKRRELDQLEQAPAGEQKGVA